MCAVTHVHDRENWDNSMFLFFMAWTLTKSFFHHGFKVLEEEESILWHCGNNGKYEFLWTHVPFVDSKTVIVLMMTMMMFQWSYMSYSADKKRGLQNGVEPVMVDLSCILNFPSICDFTNSLESSLYCSKSVLSGLAMEQTNHLAVLCFMTGHLGVMKALMEKNKIKHCYAGGQTIICCY